MKNKKRLNYASLIGVASVLACVAQAAPDTVVPPVWNTPTWTQGSKLEQFSSLPDWALSEALIDGSARLDTRFWTATTPEKALSFATLGITNTFSGAKIQVGMPLFIDMRCKLNPFDTTPPAMDPNTILCFYANEKSNLVVASSSGGTKTNTNITVSPNEYYPIMIRFATDTFDVFFTNSSVPVLSLNANTNEISKMVISGAGEMDDLYVSYGDPRRSAGYVSVGLTGLTDPITEEEKVISNWVANQKAMENATVTSITKSNAEKYYLTDTKPSDDDFDGQLGIGSFSYNPSTLEVTVVVTLKTGQDNSTKKVGKINGILQLKGAATYEAAKTGGASWVDIVAEEKVGADNFVGGVATYTFTLPNDNYKFFLPVIKSQINP